MLSTINIFCFNRNGWKVTQFIHDNDDGLTWKWRYKIIKNKKEKKKTIINIRWKVSIEKKFLLFHEMNTKTFMNFFIFLNHHHFPPSFVFIFHVNSHNDDEMMMIKSFIQFYYRLHHHHLHVDQHQTTMKMMGWMRKKWNSRWKTWKRKSLHFLILFIQFNFQ